MKKNMLKSIEGISLISLIITIIVIIILAFIIIFSSLNTPDRANFAKFAQEFSDFHMAVVNDFNNRKMKYSIDNKYKSDKAIYYEIAQGKEWLDSNNEPNSAGTVDELNNPSDKKPGRIYPEGLVGEKYYLISNDKNVSGWKQNKKYYQAEEKHYVTDEGECFILPGYRVENGEEIRWYINERKYYVSKYAIGYENGESSDINVVKYTVSFDSNGGEAVDSITDVVSGSLINMPVSPTKANGLFDGWYKENSLEHEFNFLKDTITSDITLYAKWQSYTPVEYFAWSTSGSTAIINGLSEIGESAYNDNNLTDLILPEKYNGLDVVKINNNSFLGRTKIKKVMIPNSYDCLGNNCFKDCIGMEELTIPITLNLNVSNSSHWTAQPFLYSTGLKKVNITKGTDGIGHDYVYDRMNGYNAYHAAPWWNSESDEIEITLEEGIIHLGDYYFCECIKLKGLVLPSTLTSIGKGCFLSCTGLTTIKMPSGVSIIKESSFEGCTNLSSITIPSALTTIGAKAFYNCSNIPEAVIPAGTTRIEANCFEGCINLKKLMLPDTMTYLGNNCFKDCTGMEELTIPITLNLNVSNNSHWTVEPFLNDTGLKKVHITKGLNGACQDYSNDTMNCYNSYVASPWFRSKTNEIEVILDDGITNLGNYFFCGCEGIKELVLPNSITSIGVGCFKGCTGLTRVKIPNGVTTIKESCFEECTNISVLTLPSALTELGQKAFRNCARLPEIVIPNGITGIENNCFEGCSNLKTLIIHDGVTSLGTNCFTNCVSLEELTIPITLNLNVSNTSHWTTQPFLYDTGLKKVHLTKGTDGIGHDYVYDHMDGYNAYHAAPWYQSKNNEIEVTLDDDIVYIGNYMFCECTGLKAIIYKNSSYNSLDSFEAVFVQNDHKVISPTAFNNSGIN